LGRFGSRTSDLASRYHIGTGLISVVGTSFAIIPVASGAFSQMYANGYCPVDDTGTQLACPKAYGALIGTAALCSLVEISLSFLPPKALQRIFPPIVTGPTVLLIGVDLIGSAGFTAWAGGSGLCDETNPPAFFAKCPDITAPHALPWGSASFIGMCLTKMRWVTHIVKGWGSSSFLPLSSLRDSGLPS
jgi:xanthine/uracil permease